MAAAANDPETALEAYRRQRVLRPARVNATLAWFYGSSGLSQTPINAGPATAQAA